jgi:hypothetical protein
MRENLDRSSSTLVQKLAQKAVVAPHPHRIAAPVDPVEHTSGWMVLQSCGHATVRLRGEVKTQPRIRKRPFTDV